MALKIQFGSIPYKDDIIIDDGYDVNYDIDRSNIKFDDKYYDDYAIKYKKIFDDQSLEKIKFNKMADQKYNVMSTKHKNQMVLCKKHKNINKIKQLESQQMQDELQLQELINQKWMLILSSHENQSRIFSEKYS